MCGIVGYVGTREPVPFLVEGLKRLAYRGYDSAGVAVVGDGRIQRVRAPGKIDELVRRLEGQCLAGRYGLGHTRWATHGGPSERNAHPIVDARGQVALIHNGIIENFAELKARLLAAGIPFASDTDTEVVANLIALELDGACDLLTAVRLAANRLVGHYAIAAVTTARPGDEIVVARNGPPLCIGVADGEHYLASDPAALLRHTRDIIFLENGDVARLRPGDIHVCDASGSPVGRAPRHLDWDPAQAEKGGYAHFMKKEIHEQPRAVQATVAARVRFDSGRVALADMGLDEDRLRAIRRVHLIGCGTSWHAALVGKFLIEGIARLPVDADYGSEYRYRDGIADEDALAVGITQSGETADTLSAMEAAGARGALLACICNVAGSQATRVSSGTLLTQAGPEIGVASTKAFTTQLTALYLLALYLRQLRSGEPPAHLQELARLPQALSRVLDQDEHIARLARRYAQAEDVLFLGRGINYPIALEGALKLKEISYIHAEGYPAGEMKHGPIALIDARLPTVVLATGQRLFDKMMGNIQEVKARGGRVIAVTDHPPGDLAGCADDTVCVPSVGELLQPIVNVVPLQLLAYHVAVLRGADVDQPRNLAKSVTVE